MGFYVPWVVHGSKHSARLFRRSLQLQVGAGSGVDRPGDLKVQALSVPGTGFRVAPGGGVAQSRDTSASSRESYGPILDAQLTVPSVPGTGSQAARRDLVILEITDPEMESNVYPKPSNAAGWQDGANFARITVIPDVDSMVAAAERPVRSLDQLKTGKYANVTGITLAAINWPKSTGTITNAMIEDLRQVHSPRSSIEVRGFGIQGDNKESITYSGAYPNGQTWPSASVVDEKFSIPIPDWATQFTIASKIAGVVDPSGAAAEGWAWVQVGHTSSPDRVVTEATQWKKPVSSADARGRIVAVNETRVIPAGLRGTTQVFFPRAARTSGTDATSLRTDAGSSVEMVVVFRAVPV